jgi:hypothetical protein
MVESAFWPALFPGRRICAVPANLNCHARTDSFAGNPFCLINDMKWVNLQVY